MIILYIAIAIALIVYYKFIRPMNYWKNKGVVQGNPIPFFGDMLGMVMKTKSGLDVVRELYNVSVESRYIGVYQFNVPTLLIRDLDLIKQIAVKDFDHFINHKEFIDSESDVLWGKNLFALKNQAWRDMRSTLSPSFTSSKMRAMFSFMDHASRNLVDYFKEQNLDMVEIKMKDLFTRFANDVIASTAFGITLDSLRDKNNEFYLMGTEVTNLTGFWQTVKFFIYLIAPKISRLFRIGLFSKKIHMYFKSLIENNIKTREENGIVRPDMIHLLLEARKGRCVDENVTVDTGFATAQDTKINKSSKVKMQITNEDITAQAMIFFFAGFDSSSGLMCFLSYELAVSPQIQNKLREEIFATLEQNNGKVTYETLLKMKYLDMVISETLRKWPIALVADRVCNKPYTIEPKLPGEVPVRLVPGDLLWIPLIAIQRDPKYYPDPQKFDPERFSEENVHKLNSYAFIPFGVGPRNCIGSRFAILETKLVIFHILANFELVPTDKTSIPLKISKQAFNLTEEKGFYLGLRPLIS